LKQKLPGAMETEEEGQQLPFSSALLGETPNRVAPIDSTYYTKDEVDELFQDFELEGEKPGPDQLLHATIPYHPQDITSKYIKNLEKSSPLTPDKEVDLARRIKEGERQVKLYETTARRLGAQLKRDVEDPTTGPSRIEEENLHYQMAMAQYKQAFLEAQRARNQLIEANLRLVVSIAKRYASLGLPLLDLVQEGNIGLIQAVAKFDYTKGYKVSTYASWWIRAAIMRAFAEKSRTIRIPNYLFELRTRLMKSRKYQVKKLGREPTSQELAKDSGIPLYHVKKVLNLTEEPISLNMPVSEDGSTLEAVIADRKNLSPGDYLLEKDLKYHTRRMLATLSPREEKILCLRFGIDNGEEWTLGEIGKLFGLSRERVRQIETKAIERLRGPKRYKGIREYLE